LPRPSAAETRVGGPIKGVVTWNRAGSPYIVTGDITIPAGSTLRLEPGVVLRFKPNLADQKGKKPFDLEILVEGTLEAQGADGDSVYFTSDAVDARWGDWWGILLAGPEARVKLDRVNIEFANIGVEVETGRVEMTRSAIRFCAEKGLLLREAEGQLTRTHITGVGNFSGTGVGIYCVRTGRGMLIQGNLLVGAQTGIVAMRQATVRIRENLVSLCRAHGIVVTASSPEIIGNTITQNEWGLYLRGNATPVVRDNNIFENATLDLLLTDYDMKGEGGELPELDLSGNWWGRVLADAVREKIEDGYSNPAAGARVRIEPIRIEDYQVQR
jgi:parallel beta-helix repeat protein